MPYLRIREPRTGLETTYDNWTAYRARWETVPEPLTWKPCARCWQQGRILYSHEWRICQDCLGLGYTI